MVRIVVTPVDSSSLQHGDIYSEHDQAWWDARDSVSIGHYVILRNSNPFPESGYDDSKSYKITVEPDDEPKIQPKKEEINKPPIIKTG